MLGKLGTRCSLSVYLYWERGRLSLTCMPGPSPCKMKMEGVYNSANKRCDIPPEVPVVVNIDRKENMYSGGDMHTL